MRRRECPGSRIAARLAFQLAAVAVEGRSPMTVAGPLRSRTGFLHRHRLTCDIVASAQLRRYRISRELLATTATDDALCRMAANTGDKAPPAPINSPAALTAIDMP